jgi:hypothetical protein
MLNLCRESFILKKLILIIRTRLGMVHYTGGTIVKIQHPAQKYYSFLYQ